MLSNDANQTLHDKKQHYKRGSDKPWSCVLFAGVDRVTGCRAHPSRFQKALVAHTSAGRPLCHHLGCSADWKYRGKYPGRARMLQVGGPTSPYRKGVCTARRASTSHPARHSSSPTASCRKLHPHSVHHRSSLLVQPRGPVETASLPVGANPRWARNQLVGIFRLRPAQTKSLRSPHRRQRCNRHPRLTNLHCARTALFRDKLDWRKANHRMRSGCSLISQSSRLPVHSCTLSIVCLRHSARVPAWCWCSTRYVSAQRGNLNKHKPSLIVPKLSLSRAGVQFAWCCSVGMLLT